MIALPLRVMCLLTNIAEGLYLIAIIIVYCEIIFTFRLVTKVDDKNKQKLLDFCCFVSSGSGVYQRWLKNSNNGQKNFGSVLKRCVYDVRSSKKIWAQLEVSFISIVGFSSLLPLTFEVTLNRKVQIPLLGPIVRSCRLDMLNSYMRQANTQNIKSKKNNFRMSTLIS